MIDWDRTWPLPLSGDAVTLEADLSLRRAGTTDAALWRFEPPEAPRLVRLGGGHLRLVPTLPPEPLVLRFDARLDLTPGPGRAAVFAGMPVNLRLEHVPAPGAEPAPLAERVSPGLRRHLAVGRVEDPQLARAVDVCLYDTPGAVPEGLAVMPLRLRLPETGLRSLDRVMLPAGGLSLWAGGKVLYTAAVEVDLRDADALEVHILAEVPRADVSLRFGPTSNTGEFSLKSLMRSLTQLARGAN